MSRSTTPCVFNYRDVVLTSSVSTYTERHFLFADACWKRKEGWTLILVQPNHTIFFLFADACLLFLLHSPSLFPLKKEGYRLLDFSIHTITDCNGERTNNTTSDGTCCNSTTPIDTYNGNHQPDECPEPSS